MPSLDAALQLIQAHGVWILLPLSVLEGPIVTVIAAYLAQHGYMNVLAVYLVCVLGDLMATDRASCIGRAFRDELAAGAFVTLARHHRSPPTGLDPTF